MNPQFQSLSDSSQLAIIQKKLFLDDKIRRHVNWFFLIAGLSLINTIVYLFGGHVTFVVGLGITQMVDGFMSGLAQEFGTGGIIIRLIGFAIDGAIAGIFIAFGIFGRKRVRAAVIIGMLFYAMDGVFLLLFQVYINTGFHALALFGIAGSLKPISELMDLEETGNGESIDNIRQRMSSQRPEITPGQWRTNLILVGITILILGLLYVWAIIQK